MKKSILKITAILLVFAAILSLSSCMKNKPISEKETGSDGNEQSEGGKKEEHLIHIFGDWDILTPATCFDAGERQRECTVCGRKETETLLPTGHVYSKKWTGDSYYHWHEPLCDDTDIITDKAPHDFVIEEIPVLATDEIEGTMILVCSVCNRAKTEAIPKGSHSVVYHPEVPATCEAAGVGAYYECLDCKTLFTDEAATTETNAEALVLSPSGHQKSTVYGFDGEYHWFPCTVCGERLDPEAHTISGDTCTVCKNKTPASTIGLQYRLTEDGKSYVVTGIGTSAEKNVTVPESYRGLPVTEIAAAAFSGNKTMENLTLPKTLISVGAEAFKNCSSLKKLDIPESVAFIGNGAFNGCASLSYEISGGIKYLGKWAIAPEKTGAEKLSVRQGTVGIYYAAFSACRNLKEITLPAGLKVIESYAFLGCEKLTEIKFPDTLAEIGEMAFLCCGLAEAVIPLSAEKAGNGIFFGCENLERIYLESYNIPAGFDPEWNDGTDCEYLLGDSWSYVELDAK